MFSNRLLSLLMAVSGGIGASFVNDAIGVSADTIRCSSSPPNSHCNLTADGCSGTSQGVSAGSFTGCILTCTLGGSVSCGQVGGS